ncbi:hypothetical protein [Aureimonas sp. D3]|uniref:hypothetical protein n=1 Tax=Aureimonas sp. D3 TaxID=1638164 RepID=UPI00078416FF|nr:hypothetical protein [Aureimonas sp. D3]
MPQAHLTKNGFYDRTVAADLIVGEGTFTPLPDYDPATEVPRFMGVGWQAVPLAVRDDCVPPTPPPAPVPATVTMRQARIALSRSGLLSKAEAAIAQMAGQAGEEARIEWEYAAELKRNHPLIAALGQALGLSAEAIDDLFREAATI